MTTTTILAAIGALILILHTATRIPTALADLLRACLPLLHAVHDVRTALRARPPHTGPGSGTTPAVSDRDLTPRRDDYDG
ncbi:hypothetical protein [Nonomuraea soli]|uniref:Uncharacterized protein n=1 Tax=Nonomuraea soli TaxID=1032476 RepID=A0A7W0HWF0_9ACTN|nr:hypothetical protein [Nonomuraea soli]MBA2897746.1 hypothetical protein [Nonomuraea soli]